VKAQRKYRGRRTKCGRPLVGAAVFTLLPELLRGSQNWRLAGAARTYAALYDLKSDPTLREVMTFEEHGQRYNMYYLQPRSQDDLRRRYRAHKK
jgi:hypothetical protein